MKINENYQGFELGPIRPPSEAESLMLRITRNCPWNKCKFCGLYKGKDFSVRPVEHVIQDLDTTRHYIDEINKATRSPEGDRRELVHLTSGRPDHERLAFQVALSWFRTGMKSIFLQDANTLIVRPDDLVRILNHIKQLFPEVERITSYARSKTVSRISDDDMARIAAAGLNRIHIGMESAADEVLKFIKKGVDKKTHILAGQKVKRAGIELSEYFMPGLGGVEFSQTNALETADAINQINPDFIRIRTLAIPETTELYKDYQSGAFKKPGDVETAKELLQFIDALGDITSTIKSDHILNLFQEVDGTLPKDKERITAPIRKFLDMDPEKQVLYMVGRRSGILTRIDDMNDTKLMQHVEASCRNYNISPDTVNQFTDAMMSRFI